MAHIGRFAPSPTGPLHIGSLLAAVASYLDAKANGGRWLLRLEDLDPPRELKGAADTILKQLEELGLHWDGEVLRQSSRLDAYNEALQKLWDDGLCFHCDCTRPKVRAMGSVYNGHCRTRNDQNKRSSAIRLRTRNDEIAFDDRVFGSIRQKLEQEVGDFIIKRKDGLFAYQLAVVIDDSFQKISHVMRGFDLLDSTPRQIYLQQLLNLPTPHYAHIPLVVDDQGQKFSKQQFAKAIDSTRGSELIHTALMLLNQPLPPEIQKLPPQEILAEATACWDIQTIPKLANIPFREADTSSLKSASACDLTAT